MAIILDISTERGWMLRHVLAEHGFSEPTANDDGLIEDYTTWSTAALAELHAKDHGEHPDGGGGPVLHFHNDTPAAAPEPEPVRVDPAIPCHSLMYLDRDGDDVYCTHPDHAPQVEEQQAAPAGYDPEGEVPFPDEPAPAPHPARGEEMAAPLMTTWTNTTSNNTTDYKFTLSSNDPWQRDNDPWPSAEPAAEPDASGPPHDKITSDAQRVWEQLNDRQRRRDEERATRRNERCHSSAYLRTTLDTFVCVHPDHPELTEHGLTINSLVNIDISNSPWYVNSAAHGMTGLVTGVDTDPSRPGGVRVRLLGSFRSSPQVTLHPKCLTAQPLINDDLQVGDTVVVVDGDKTPWGYRPEVIGQRGEIVEVGVLDGNGVHIHFNRRSPVERHTMHQHSLHLIKQGPRVDWTFDLGERVKIVDVTKTPWFTDGSTEGWTGVVQKRGLYPQDPPVQRYTVRLDSGAPARATEIAGDSLIATDEVVEFVEDLPAAWATER